LQTERQHIIDLLSEREMDARELSRILGIQEKEIYRHLTHIQKSVASQGKKLIIKPFQCLSCGSRTGSDSHLPDAVPNVKAHTWRSLLLKFIRKFPPNFTTKLQLCFLHSQKSSSIDSSHHFLSLLFCCFDYLEYS